MIGVKTVADVYRTLDKMSMRKEYHEALVRAGISFDYIVNGLRAIANDGEKDADKLKAFQTLLKSLGLEKYDAADSPTGGTWEEELVKVLEKEKPISIGHGGGASNEKIDYEVIEPEVPESIKKIRNEEEELTDGIYE